MSERVKNRTALRKLMSNRDVYVSFRRGARQHSYNVRTTTGEADFLFRVAESNGQEMFAEIYPGGLSNNVYLTIHDKPAADSAAWRAAGDVEPREPGPEFPSDPA